MLARARDGKTVIENLKEEKESLNTSEDSSFGRACSKVVQLITRFTGILRAHVGASSKRCELKKTHDR